MRYTDNQKDADSRFGVAVTPLALYPSDTFMSRELVESLTANAGETCPPGAPGVDPVTAGRSADHHPACCRCSTRSSRPAKWAERSDWPGIQ